MRSNLMNFFTAVLFLSCAAATNAKAAAAPIIVKADRAAIVVSTLDAIGPTTRKQILQLYQDAVTELQKHLQLITGVKIPIREQSDISPDGFVFKIGITPESDTKPLAEQEARWRVTPDSVYFYGGLERYSWSVHNAVYDFLEQQLGVTWIESGDAGIVYSRHSHLKLRLGARSWIPQLMFRKIRQSNRIQNREAPIPKRLAAFPEFHLSMAANNQKTQEVVRWQRRMRMGGSRPGGGHAFATWWNKYGETHPEYFALNKYGKREPVPLPKVSQTNSLTKICPSNPAVANQIVMDWLPKKDRQRYVNVGMNDGTQNFCECKDCKKLDVRLEGETMEAHLTDRYVHLANAVAREVRKHRPDAMVSMYAYLTTLHPPRKLKLEPNVVVQIVPYVIPLDTQITDQIIGGWYDAGATQIAFRPNYHFKYHTMPLPLGIEKQMFDVFQLAV